MNTTLKKRSFSLLLSFLVILFSLPFAFGNVSAGDSDPFDTDGDGSTNVDPFLGSVTDDTIGQSEGNPFILYNNDDLLILSSIVNNSSVNLSDGSSKNYGKFACEGYFFKLDSSFNNSETPFDKRIGINTTRLFQGTFDGNKDACVQVNFINTTDIHCGLFGCIGGSATIKNVSTFGNVKASKNSVGGVVGTNNGGSIVNCANYATVSGNANVGGICGDNSGFITNCYNKGIVTGTGNYVGGICGKNSGSVVNCANYATVVSAKSMVGGVVGDNVTSGSVKYSYYDKGAQVLTQEEIDKNYKIPGSAIYSVSPDTGTALGLPTKQCVAATNAQDKTDFFKIGDLGEISLVDALNEYVNTYNNLLVPPTFFAGSLLGDKATIDVILPCDINNIKLLNWKIDNVQDSDSCDYPILTEVEAIEAVDVDLTIDEPTLGADLPVASVTTATSDTGSVTAEVTATAWKCNSSPITGTVNKSGTYEATIMFSLTSTAPSIIDETTTVKVKLNGGQPQTVTPTGGVYTVTQEFKLGGEEIDKVSVNMFLSKPTIGCKLRKAKVVSRTNHIKVKNVRTTWFDSRHRIATKAHLGGKYTAMVSFKLDTAEEYDIADGAKVWVRLNGKRVRATKRGDTYTVMCSFKKLSICNVISDIYKNLFWRIF